MQPMGQYDELLKDFDPYPIPSRSENVFDEKPPKLEADYYCRSRHKIKQGENAGKYKYCYLRAGYGTGHLGYGRCKFHGGATPLQENRYANLLNPTLDEMVQKFYDDPDPLNLRPELAVARALLQEFISNEEEYTEALLAWWASFDRERRGLHDHPLYNIRVIKHALDNGMVGPDMSLQELQHELEDAVEGFKDKWVEEQKEKKVPDPDPTLSAAKPRKVMDKVAAMRILGEIRATIKDIQKLEQEAYLSVYALEGALEKYGQIVREVLVGLLREKGIDIDDAEKTIEVIAERWETIPLAESSVPRLTAQTGGRQERAG